MPPKQSMTARNVLALIREQEILTARVHVCDTNGDDIVFSLQAASLEESAFKDGIPISSSTAKLLTPDCFGGDVSHGLHHGSNLHVLLNADSIRVRPEEVIEFDGNLISPETWAPVWWDSRSVAQRAGVWLSQLGSAGSAKFAAQFTIETSGLTQLQQKRLLEEISGLTFAPQYLQQAYSYRDGEQGAKPPAGSNSRIVVQLRMADLIQMCDQWMHLRQIITRNSAEYTSGSIELDDPVGIQISLNSVDVGDSALSTGVMSETDQLELLNSVRGLLVENLSNIERLVSRSGVSRWREKVSKKELQELVRLEYVPDGSRNTLALQICVVGASSNPYFGTAAIAVMLAAGLQSGTLPQLEPTSVLGTLVNFEVGSLLDAEILTAGDVFSEQLLESLSK